MLELQSEIVSKSTNEIIQQEDRLSVSGEGSLEFKGLREAVAAQGNFAQQFMGEHLFNSQNSFTDIKEIIQNSAIENGNDNLFGKGSSKLFDKALGSKDINEIKKLFNDFYNELSDEIINEQKAATNRLKEKIKNRKDDLQKVLEDKKSNKNETSGNTKKDTEEIKTNTAEVEKNTQAKNINDMTIDELEAEIANLTAKEASLNQQEKDLTNTTNDLGNSQDTLKDKLQSLKDVDWGKGLPALASTVSGLMSVFNSAEAMGSGNGGLKGIVSSLIPIVTMIPLINTGTKTLIDIFKIKLPAAIMTTKGSIDAATMGITLIISAVITLIGVVAGLHAKAKQAQKDALKAESDLLIKQNELIDSTSSLTTEVEGLVESYGKLKENGDDTFETLEKLKDQVPDLIKQYKDLEEAANVDLNTAKIQALYYAALESGDWTEFLAAINETKKEAEDVKFQNSKEALGSLESQMKLSGTGQYVNAVTYTVNGETKTTVGGYQNTFSGVDSVQGEEALAAGILKETLGEFITYGGPNSITIKVPDDADTGAMYRYVKALNKAKATLENRLTPNQLSNSGIYEDVRKECEALNDLYGDASIQYEVVSSGQSKQFEENGFTNDAFNQKMSFSEFYSNRNAMIEDISSTYGKNPQEAESMLSGNSTTSLNENLFNKTKFIDDEIKKLTDEQATLDTSTKEGQDRNAEIDSQINE